MMAMPQQRHATSLDGDPERWIGQSRLRCEDDRLVRGNGCFVDDIKPETCAYVIFVRSPVASAEIKSVDKAAARAARGVLAVLSAEDFGDISGAAVNPVVEGMQLVEFTVLARDRVSAVGQPVAMVIAETLAQAIDAVDLVAIDYHACEPDPGGAGFAHRSTLGDCDSAFSKAVVIASVCVQHARLAPMSLEPRAVVADYDRAQGNFTIWLSTQTPWRAHAELSRILGLAPARVRVVAPDVGGSFGGKASIYPEEVAVAWASIALGRPLKWCATRSDEFLAATHGRGGTLRGKLALADNGKFLGLKAELDFPLGNWMPFSAAIPGSNAARILPGPYQVGSVEINVTGRITPHAPIGIYRGAGRPEAAMLMERLVDEAARLLGMDPAQTSLDQPDTSRAIALCNPCWRDNRFRRLPKGPA